MGSMTHTATKLVDETWFIEGRHILSRGGVQVGTIVEVLEVRIERRTSEDPEVWEVAVDADAFSSLQVADDSTNSGVFADSIVAGILAADPDDDPEPGNSYMMLAICTIEFTALYGGHRCGKVFRRPWRIPASALTAPAS